MSRRKDLTGRTFGRLTVLQYHGTNKYGKALWLCQCECGQQKIVIGENLNAGRTQSCGCYNKERSIEVNTTHGMTKTRLYECWLGIKKRCDDVNNKEYPNYGGRGITYCKEWAEFEPFKNWALNNGYSDKLTLDRIDVDKEYSPSNCRWSTWGEQAKNKRVSPKNKLGISGVHYDKRRNAYIVRIGINGIRKYIGKYETLQEAENARREAERKYWG